MEKTNHKRIKVSSLGQLRGWLAQNDAPAQGVMIVTCDRSSPTKHISSTEVRDASREAGWVTGPSYTLNGGLLGHIIRKN